MKKLILSLSMIISFIFVGAQTIDFESKVIDYGVIEHNSDGNREYKFTNNGDKPLIIKAKKEVVVVLFLTIKKKMVHLSGPRRVRNYSSKICNKQNR